MQTMMILRGGRVLDPASGLDRVCDVMIENGRIGAVGQISPTPGAVAIDASGMLVTPGLIDYHTHLYDGCSVYGFQAERLFPSGVTMAVDAGTTGFITYEAFHRFQQSCQMPWRAFLNLSPIGQPGGGAPDALDPAGFDEVAMARVLERYPEELVGLKIRINRGNVGTFGIRSLEKALEIAGSLQKPLCVHVTDPCVPMAQISDMLRPGDIFCHVFHGRGDTILDETGRVAEAFWRAKERGVIFDASNGQGNFVFWVARPSLEQGFLPDVISTDLTAASLYRGELANNLPFLMSKYMAMGMEPLEVFRAATATPAKLLGCPDRGSLMPGGRADVAIFSLTKRPVFFRDCTGEALKADQVLVNHMTILAGQPVFDDNALPRLPE